MTIASFSQYLGNCCVLHTMNRLQCRLIEACIFSLGFIVGVPQSQACDVLEFDGANDRVVVPYDDSFPIETFTLAAWIKLAPPGHRSAVIAHGEDDNSFNLSWQIYINPDGTFQIMLENQNEQNFTYPLTFAGEPQASCDNAQGLLVADDQWHHVAVTRELSGALIMYIDGVSRAVCEQTGVPSSNNFQRLSIGCTYGTIGPPPGGVEPPIWFFPGLIDDPAVWNAALAPLDLQQVYDNGVDSGDERLIGYWKFDEGSGQIVEDLSGVGNHGFLGSEPTGDVADPLWVSAESPACASGTPIPAASGWALVVLVLGFCCVGTLVLLDARLVLSAT